MKYIVFVMKLVVTHCCTVHPTRLHLRLQFPNIFHSSVASLRKEEIFVCHCFNSSVTLHEQNRNCQEFVGAPRQDYH